MPIDQNSFASLPSKVLPKLCYQRVSEQVLQEMITTTSAPPKDLWILRQTRIIAGLFDLQAT
jgi:hypothetical protein